MNDKIEMDLTTWSPTYGLLTAQRILGRFHIHLANDELHAAINHPLSVYYLLLRVPLKNVFNGIIFQQAQDYQTYAQKLFIDYLLSGESAKEETAPGANTREDLEVQRLKLTSLGDEFSQAEVDQYQLISDSQACLIELAGKLQAALAIGAQKIGQILQSRQISSEEKLIQPAIRTALINFDKADTHVLAASSPFWTVIADVLKVNLDNELREQLSSELSPLQDPRMEIEQALATFLEQTEMMGLAFRRFRASFYEIILKTTELINLLPDYVVDRKKDDENRSTLHFDSHIGGD